MSTKKCTKKLGLLAVMLGIFSSVHDIEASMRRGGGMGPAQTGRQPSQYAPPSGPGPKRVRLPSLSPQEEQQKSQMIADLKQVAGYDATKLRAQVEANPQSYISTMPSELNLLKRKYVLNDDLTLKEESEAQPGEQVLESLSPNNLILKTSNYTQDILGRALIALHVNDLPTAMQLRSLYDAITTLREQAEAQLLPAGGPQVPTRGASGTEEERKELEQFESYGFKPSQPTPAPVRPPVQPAGGPKPMARPTTMQQYKPYTAAQAKEPKRPEVGVINQAEQDLMRHIASIKDKKAQQWEELKRLTKELGVGPDAIAWYEERMSEMESALSQPGANKPELATQAQGYIFAQMRLHALLEGGEADTVEQLIKRFRNLRDRAGGVKGAAPVQTRALQPQVPQQPVLQQPMQPMRPMQPMQPMPSRRVETEPFAGQYGVEETLGLKPRLTSEEELFAPTRQPAQRPFSMPQKPMQQRMPTYQPYTTTPKQQEVSRPGAAPSQSQQPGQRPQQLAMPLSQKKPTYRPYTAFTQQQQQQEPQYESLADLTEAVEQVSRMRDDNPDKMTRLEELQDRIGTVERTIGDAGKFTEEGYAGLKRKVEDMIEDLE